MQDQCCAFGRVPLLMLFEGEALACEQLCLGAPLHLVLVDLRCMHAGVETRSRQSCRDRLLYGARCMCMMAFLCRAGPERTPCRSSQTCRQHIQRQPPRSTQPCTTCSAPRTSASQGQRSACWQLGTPKAWVCYVSRFRWWWTSQSTAVSPQLEMRSGGLVRMPVCLFVIACGVAVQAPWCVRRSASLTPGRRRCALRTSRRQCCTACCPTSPSSSMCGAARAWGRRQAEDVQRLYAVYATSGKTPTCCTAEESINVVRRRLQGDGTAQLVCRSAADQTAVCVMLERDLGLHCTPLTLQPTSGGLHSTAAPEVHRWQSFTWQPAS